jgi:hypothetical protein
VLTLEDPFRVEPELVPFKLADRAALADACSSLMGCLTHAYMESTGDYRLRTLSDVQVGRVINLSLKRADVPLDRKTRRSVSKYSGHILRMWRSLEGSWPGGDGDFDWVIYLVISASDALRRRGADVDAEIERWLRSVSDLGTEA